MTNEVHCTDLVGLRNLRLWHWKQFQLFTKQKQEAQANRAWLVPNLRGMVTFHLRAVQKLNTLFPIDDTAEKDAAKVRVSPNTKAP